MFFKRKMACALLAGSALGFFSTQAAAQNRAAEEASANTNIADDIIVTAQKRTERLMDVPLSITAASGEQLVKQGVTQTAQLTKLVPGFTYQESNYGTPVFTIRGIGFQDGSFGAGPTVTTYIDQVPLPYPILTRGAALDLERVEVLKGPQGTLFGQNSTGGAINYIAAKPTSDLSAGMTLSYGRFNDVSAEAFVSGPLSSTLRARVAVRSEFADGWQRSLTRPGDRFGKKEFYNGRLLLDWTPNDRLSFVLNVSGWQDNSEVAAGQFQQFAPLVPANPLTQFIYDALSTAPVANRNARDADWTPGTGHQNNTFYLVSLRGDWNISDQLTLTSVTAYSKLVAHSPFDPDGVAFSNFENVVRDALLTSFSQELRLAGTTGPLKWMLGGNYQRDIANQFPTVLVNDATNGVLPTPTGPVFQDASAYIFNQQPTFKSVFGSLDYALTNQLTVQGSIRYTHQDRHFVGCIMDAPAGPNGTGTVGQGFLGFSELLSGSPSTIGPDGCLTMNDVTFKPEKVFRRLKEDNVAWRGSLNWKPDDASMIYASVTKGYKAGNFATVPGVLSSEFEPIKQESVLSYEVGAKHSFNRRVDVSAAAYYYDYRDKQLLGVANYPVFENLPKLVNIPKSRIWGAELEVTARPIDRLRIQGGVSYVNSRVKEDPAIPLDPYGNPTTFVGEPFPNTPKWQIVGDAEYGIPLSATAQAFVGGSVSYRGKSNAAFGERSEFALPSYTLIDLRAGVEWEKWRLQVWGRNITNKYYWINVSHILDTVARTAGMPVIYGVTLGYRF
ncbi:TonB-dependent receptor [Rhizorhapis sp.]|uniref:TonB-dependent receptor n=1 Tax=Rhizorhapis sp. TaxID=1968842 RepID=UPI002B4939F7|nr:TonB-dependent receptor [Rhizorhapis sp.]